MACGSKFWPVILVANVPPFNLRHSKEVLGWWMKGITMEGLTLLRIPWITDALTPLDSRYISNHALACTTNHNGSSLHFAHPQISLGGIQESHSLIPLSPLVLSPTKGLPSDQPGFPAHTI